MELTNFVKLLLARNERYKRPVKVEPIRPMLIADLSREIRSS